MRAMNTIKVSTALPAGPGRNVAKSINDGYRAFMLRRGLANTPEFAFGERMAERNRRAHAKDDRS